MKNKVFDYLVENYCYENFYFKDVRIEQPNGLFKTVYKVYDLIVFNLKKIIFFTYVDEKISNTDVDIYLKNSLNFIANKLSLSLNDFFVCGINEEKLYIFNTYNGRLFSFDKTNIGFEAFSQYVEDEFVLSSELFEYLKLKSLSEELSFSSSIKSSERLKNKVIVNSDGITFINKHGSWYEASEYNTDQVFMLTVFGGMFGAHLFYLKKRAKAILYFLTFGCVGIGWLFDSLEIIFGIYKDRNGKYLLPLENKISGFIMLFVGAVVFCFLGLLMMFLMKFILQGSSSVLNSFVSRLGA